MAEEANVEVRHSADVSVARGEVRRLGVAVGLSDVAVEELAVAVTELGQNIVLHGGGSGSLRLEIDPGSQGVLVRARDRGPGLDAAKIASAIRAAGSHGQGLASVGRLMNVVELRLGKDGADVACRKWVEPRGRRLPRVVAIQRPHPREQLCGDAAFVERQEGRLRLSVIDGLGHGPSAHEAAAAGVMGFKSAMDRALPLAVAAAHEALGRTRGAALSVADVDVLAGTLSATSVGNVRLAVLREGAPRWAPIGIDAVAGHGRPGSGGVLHPRIESTTWSPGCLMLLYSDGVSSRLTLPSGIPAIQADPLGTAVHVFQGFAGETDDATLMLAV